MQQPVPVTFSMDTFDIPQLFSRLSTMYNWRRHNLFLRRFHSRYNASYHHILQSSRTSHRLCWSGWVAQRKSVRLSPLRSCVRFCLESNSGIVVERAIPCVYVGFLQGLRFPSTMQNSSSIVFRASNKLKFAYVILMQYFEKNNV